MSLGRDRPLSLPWRVTDERTTDVFRAPRGTHDVLPADFAIQRYVGETAARVAALAGYEPIATPVIEDADLFVRSVGDGTDIVEKEMYLFDDRGGDRLALRPESTAAVCRAYLEHGLANQPQPVKLYYEQPNFRYERPQAGRYRQHTQFGIEAIGVLDPALDAEVIELGWRIAEELGLRELTLLLNSIGDAEDRRAYVPLLQEHFRPHLALQTATHSQTATRNFEEFLDVSLITPVLDRGFVLLVFAAFQLNKCRQQLFGRGAFACFERIHR